MRRIAQRGNRRHRDHHATLDSLERHLRRKHDRAKVQVEYGSPFLDRGQRVIRIVDSACVVHENVDPAQLRLGLLEEAAHVAVTRHVDLDERPADLDCGPSARFHVDVGDDDMRAVLCEHF